MGLVGSAVICGQALSGRAEAAGMQEEEVPTVGKITKAGIKYFDFRVGEGPSPRCGENISCFEGYVSTNTVASIHVYVRDLIPPPPLQRRVWTVTAT